MKHPKIHINQVNKDQILKAARETQQITHKGISIRITADLSIETVQARREWQDILKVMKEPTSKMTLLSKDLIQIPRRNQKLYRQAKVKRIQHHQTSSSTNAKVSSLDRKHRRDLFKLTQNNKVNDNGIILINYYLKCK